MITGVSLKGAETALVLLEEYDAAHHPVALAITGQYDRLGSIDMVDEDDNTEIVMEYFLGRLAAKDFVVDEDDLRTQKCFPIKTVEHLLRGFERNVNDGMRTALLRGRPIVYALIAGRVWAAVARTGTFSDDLDASFRRVFGGTPVAAEINL
jgi:hypothetical protein